MRRSARIVSKTVQEESAKRKLSSKAAEKKQRITLSKRRGKRKEEEEEREDEEEEEEELEYHDEPQAEGRKTDEEIKKQLEDTPYMFVPCCRAVPYHTALSRYHAVPYHTTLPCRVDA
jgi:hypothetical protein